MTLVSTTASTVSLLTALSLLPPAPADDAPIELGTIGWTRDFPSGLAAAGDTDRDLLMLFQEVPGWSTCQDFGAQVLSHPIIVAAAEQCFVPVCIYNNREGEDSRVLGLFEEPAWNNPVLRIVGTDRTDVVARNGRGWTVQAVAAQMVAALTARSRPVPGYLDALVAEESAKRRGLEAAVFGMGWYWVGEVEFGLIPGVISTRAGWIGDVEVVDVLFNPDLVTFTDLLRRGRTRDCARQVFARSEAQMKVARPVVGELAIRSDAKIRTAKDDKYHLTKSLLRHIPMTATQASRCNADIAHADKWLAPFQLRLRDEIEANPDAGWPVVIGESLEDGLRKVELARVRAAVDER